MSFFPDVSFTLVNVLIFLEQFGYGFGFTAYMLFLIYYSRGTHKTAHYAICTAFMALSMMIPGLFAGFLEEAFGYRNFFIGAMLLCLVTVGVSLLIKIDPDFGKRSVDA
jgi:PAT family beta-lactamase induction signal transducer AmpG